MRRLIVTVVLASVVLTSTASATILGTVNLQNHNNALSDVGKLWGGGLSGLYAYTGIYSWINAGGTGSGTDVPNWGFCIELTQGPYTGWQDVIPLNEAPLPAQFGTPMQTTKADYICELWDKHFDSSWLTGGTANKQMAEAFGAAVWEIIYETLPASPLSWDVTAGTGFRATGIEQAAIANDWLHQLEGITTHSCNLVATSAPTGQDYLVQLPKTPPSVPEPATIVLLGLGALVLLRKENKKVKRLILTTCLCVLFMTRGSLSVTPIELTNTSTDVSIGGMVHINGNFPSKYTSYNQQEHSNGFISGDTQLAASMMTDNRRSSTSATFEQLAFDKDVQSLTSTATGQSLRTEPSEFDFGNLEEYLPLNIYNDFLTLDLPSQPRGAASTILLELEHFGNLPSINNDRAYDQAYINISAQRPGPGLIYDRFLDTLELTTAEFDWSEFTGTRNITRNRSILTHVGETMNLFAEFNNDMFANLSAKSGF